MDYREELFKALTAGVDGVFRDKSIDALVEVCRAARKEGYNAGFENGNISDGTFDEKIKEAYENGADDVWECVNKIYSKIDQAEVETIFGVKYYDVFEKFTASEAMAKVKEYEKEVEFKIGDRVEVIRQLFYTSGKMLFPVGTVGEISYINHDDTYKVRTDADWNNYPADALKLANDVFLVGDEVYLLDKNYRGVVTAVWEHCGVKVETLTQSGKLSCTDAKDLHRTGRRFPEIGNILKQMQEGEA